MLGALTTKNAKRRSVGAGEGREMIALKRGLGGDSHC